MNPLVVKELQELSAGYLDTYPSVGLIWSFCGGVRKGMALVVHVPLAGIHWNRDRGAMRPTRAADLACAGITTPSPLVIELR